MNLSSHGRAGKVVLGGFALILLLVILLAGDLPTNDWTFFYQLSGIAFILIVSVPIIGIIVNGGRFFDTPICYAAVCYAAFIGIGPLLAMYAASALPVDAVQLIEPKAVAVSWLGLLAMFGGYLITQPTRERLQSRPQRATREVDLRTLEGVAWFYLVLGFAGVAIYLTTVGGIGFLISANYRTRGVTPHLTEGLTYEAIRPALLILIFSAICTNRFRRFRFVALMCLTGFAVLWFGPLRGSRNQILTLMTALWFILTRTERQRSYRSKVIGGVICVGAVFLVLVWGAQRAEHSLSDMDVSKVPVGGTASAAMYSPFKTLNDIVTYVPSRNPYLYGSSLVESLTVWIPREFWPDKPAGIGTDAQDLFEARGGSNSVPTWPGELYWNFGIPGVIVGLLFMGMVCGWWARLNYDNGESELEGQVRRLLYAVCFPVLLIWIWEGSDQAVWYSLEDIVPVALAVFCARRIHLFSREVRSSNQGAAGYAFQRREMVYAGQRMQQAREGGGSSAIKVGTNAGRV